MSAAMSLVFKRSHCCCARLPLPILLEASSSFFPQTASLPAVVQLAAAGWRQPFGSPQGRRAEGVFVPLRTRTRAISSALSPLQAQPSGDAAAAAAGRRSRQQQARAAVGAAAGHVTQELQQQTLVLYSKPGCCLCDGLKEKLDVILMTVAQRGEAAAVAAAVAGAGTGGYTVVTGEAPSVLQNLRVEVRDITTNPEWMRLYEFEIPVMTRLVFTDDGSVSEVVIPRQSPRVSIDKLRKVLEAAFAAN